jgi:hypothetical protein
VKRGDSLPSCAVPTSTTTPHSRKSSSRRIKHTPHGSRRECAVTPSLRPRNIMFITLERKKALETAYTYCPACTDFKVFLLRENMVQKYLRQPDLDDLRNLRFTCVISRPANPKRAHGFICTRSMGLACDRSYIRPRIVALFWLLHTPLSDRT